MMNRNIIYIALGTGALLLIPLLGNWPWTLSDFVIMGTFIFGTGLVYEFVTRKLDTPRQKLTAGIVILFMFLLIWGELAVGIFGTPFAGN